MAERGMSEFRSNGVDYILNDPNIAEEFTTGKSYNTGETAYYQGVLYEFTTFHVAGAWNSGHVKQISIGTPAALMGGYKINTYRTASANKGSVTINNISNDWNNISFSLAGYGVNAGVYSNGAIIFDNKKYIVSLDIAADISDELTIITGERFGNFTFRNSGHFIFAVDRANASENLGLAFYVSKYNRDVTINITNFKVICVDGQEGTALADIYTLINKANSAEEALMKLTRVDVYDLNKWAARIGGAVSTYPTRLYRVFDDIFYGDRIVLTPVEATNGLYSYYVTEYDSGGNAIVENDWSNVSNGATVEYAIQSEDCAKIELVFHGRNDPDLISPSTWPPFVNSVTIYSYVQPRNVQLDLDKLKQELIDADIVFDYDDVVGPYSAAYYRNFVAALEGISGSVLFALQTDTHYGMRNAYASAYDRVTELVQLTRLTKIPMVTNLGDLVNGWSTKPNQMLDISRIVHHYMECKSAYVQVIGNHDDNSWYDNQIRDNTGESDVFPDEWNQLVNIPITANKDVVTMPGVRYGVFEDVPNKVRYIYLDTEDFDYSLKTDQGKMKYQGQWTSAIRQQQIDFLIESLKTLRSDYKVIILSHICLDSDDSDTAIINGDIVQGILEAFVDSTTYTATGSTADFEVSVDVDFTNKQGTLIGCFSGHEHADAMYTRNGITYVLTDNTTVFTDDPGDTDRSNTDETANVTDVIVVNFSTKLVTIKRFGYGSDRTFTYT